MMYTIKRGGKTHIPYTYKEFPVDNAGDLSHRPGKLPPLTGKLPNASGCDEKQQSAEDIHNVFNRFAANRARSSERGVPRLNTG
jgi:hypothetical protein